MPDRPPGHTSLVVTMTVYAHVLPGSKRKPRTC